MKIAATVAALIFFMWFDPRVGLADPVKDGLDHARNAYGAAEAKAASDLTNAFDEQIKAVGPTADFDAVQQLRAERAAFVSFSLVTIPNSAVMRTAVARYQRATVSAQAALRTAYESAASEYAIKHGMV
jgi:hypothetical protein